MGIMARVPYYRTSYFLSPEQAAEALGMAKITMILGATNYRRSGGKDGLPYKRISSKLMRIHPADLFAWQAAKGRKPLIEDTAWPAPTEHARPPYFLSVTQAAEIAGVHHTTIDREVFRFRATKGREGLPHKRDGFVVRIRARDFFAWMQPETFDV